MFSAGLYTWLAVIGPFTLFVPWIVVAVMGILDWRHSKEVAAQFERDKVRARVFNYEMAEYARALNTPLVYRKDVAEFTWAGDRCILVTVAGMPIGDIDTYNEITGGRLLEPTQRAFEAFCDNWVLSHRMDS